MMRNRAIPGDSDRPQEQALLPATANQRRANRVRSWRRRVLQRRGALMHNALLRESEHSSLAMLDETGKVVSWYGEAGASSEHVVDRHVSQFYLPTQIAGNQPLRDLRAAAVLRDGRLQGSLYVMRAAPERVSRRASWFAHLLLGLSVCASLPIAAAPSALPDHAVASRYGSGWDCKRGFRRVGDTCAQITVPAHAYLDASGTSWRCDRGYLNVNDRCIVIQVPQNAYLDDVSGKGWRCDRNFRESPDACMPITVPANAHANGSSYGAGWDCDRGFRLLGAACAQVAVPVHGLLSRSGDKWECERGFRKDNAACVAVQLPADAHLDYSGNSWTCDVGFHTHADKCTAD